MPRETASGGPANKEIPATVRDAMTPTALQQLLQQQPPLLWVTPLPKEQGVRHTGGDAPSLPLHGQSSHPHRTPVHMMLSRIWQGIAQQ
jgi:hypothetical protein